MSRVLFQTNFQGVKLVLFFVIGTSTFSLIFINLTEYAVTGFKNCHAFVKVNVYNGSLVQPYMLVQIEEKPGVFPLCSNEDRLRHVQKFCSASSHLRHPVKNVSYDRLLFNEERKVIYCFIYKASSSTWKALMINSTLNKSIESRTKYNYDTISNSLMMHHPSILKASGIVSGAAMKYSKESTVQLQRALNDPSYTKFMVVRNPFERLVSAFYDRLIYTQTKKYPLNNTWEMDRRDILRRFRTNASDADIRNAASPTLEEFVHWALDLYNTSQHWKMLHRVDRDMSVKDDRTLLKQSVRPIILPTGSVHWDPYWNECDPCNVQYDYILRTETLAFDSAPIMKKLGFEGKEPGKLHRFNDAHLNMDRYYEEMYLEDLETISKKDIQDLRTWYSNERDMFGYDIDEQTLFSKCQIKNDKGESCC